MKIYYNKKGSNNPNWKGGRYKIGMMKSKKKN